MLRSTLFLFLFKSKYRRKWVPPAISSSLPTNLYSLLFIVVTVIILVCCCDGAGARFESGGSSSSGEECARNCINGDCIVTTTGTIHTMHTIYICSDYFFFLFYYIFVKFIERRQRINESQKLNFSDGK